MVDLGIGNGEWGIENGECNRILGFFSVIAIRARVVKNSLIDKNIPNSSLFPVPRSPFPKKAQMFVTRLK